MAGGNTTRKDIRIIPRQEVKTAGKTSKLSQKNIRIIPRQEINPPKKHKNYPKEKPKVNKKGQGRCEAVLLREKKISSISETNGMENILGTIQKESAEGRKSKETLLTSKRKTWALQRSQEQKQEAKSHQQKYHNYPSRKQNQQKKHQNYAKAGGKTSRKNIRVTPRQEAKPPGKISGLSQGKKPKATGN